MGLTSRAISSLVDRIRHQTGRGLTKRAWFGVGAAASSYFSTGLLYLQSNLSLLVFSLKSFCTIRCKLCKGLFLDQLCKKSPIFKGEKSQKSPYLDNELLEVAKEIAKELSRIQKKFLLCWLTSIQIWLIPPVHYCQSTYSTNRRRKLWYRLIEISSTYNYQSAGAIRVI